LNEKADKFGGGYVRSSGISLSPRQIVEMDTPEARATFATPPYPRDLASAATAKRRPRSFSAGNNAANFCLRASTRTVYLFYD
jgi:hypothetical protein